MSEDEIYNPSFGRCHLVILGAGASRAAFPNGDVNGRPVPVMDDLILHTGLESILQSAGIEGAGRNFEELYGELRADDRLHTLADGVEERVRRYFAELSLPSQPCLYDHLLLSLRSKDVIATFNWDPLLFDACLRNASVKRLPHIIFLHGNVRVGGCPIHGSPGFLWDCCRECGEPLAPVKLLFPVKDKTYTDDPFIAGQWQNFRAALQNAYILTIFGYGAPKSDVAAITTMKEAWRAPGGRQLEQIEIINTAPRDELESSWKEFFYKGIDHYEIVTDFYQSWCARHPRRSCEAFWDQSQKMNCKLPRVVIPRNADFPDLWSWFAPLIDAEARTAEKDWTEARVNQG